MAVQSYPLWLSIYKGEGRILIIPFLRHIGGYSVRAEWFVNIQDVEDYVSIGEGAIGGLDFIKSSPRSTLTQKEFELNAAWKKNSKYKSWNSFWKNNHLAYFEFFEDGHYEVQLVKKSDVRRGGYGGYFEEISLSANATAEEIGKAIVEVLDALEEFENGRNLVIDPYLVKQIELLDEDETPLSMKWPRDRHFVDAGDGHTGEIYQCYSYLPQADAEDSAVFLIGMAAELNCDLSEENIRETWDRIHGKADSFEIQEVEYGIFKLRVEMRNKKIHVISYLLQLEGEESDLLECTMYVYQPNRRKKLDEKLEKLFEEFALSCKM